MDEKMNEPPFHKDLWADLQDRLVSGDPTVVGIVVALVVVFLTILVFTCRRGASKGRCVLLVGLCDSGKTLMYSQLIHGQHRRTQTSTKENNGTYEPDGKKVLRLIDVPGHERIRDHIIEKYKGATRGLIFVVDSQTFQRELKDVAEFLYTLLTDKVITLARPPVLIVCNKQDITLAKGAKVVQSLLEKEINTLRTTKSGQLLGTDGGGSAAAFLGHKDRDFSFSDVKQFKVEFVESSARGTKSETDGGALEEVREWLQNVA